MKPRVKICGITNKEDALLCAHAGADALGFIFYPKSPRYIDPMKAKMIIDTLPPFVTPVGVFVNEQRERINQIISISGIRALQLSGDEKSEDCENYPIDVIKAFRIRDKSDFEYVKQYPVSAVMLDGADKDTYGGSGTLADFSIAVELKKYFLLILSGGLSPDNITDAVNRIHPYAIDINSGIEHSPGHKDHHNVRLLFERLHQIEE
ncbi:MAG: phosphoribosylanthranilate isomerase [Bacteroidota bacterium]